MPAYTILMMRKDDPGRRPLTIHISSGLFWSVIVLAVGLPIMGFLVSAGLLAPAWLKLNFKNMQQAVTTAEQNIQPLQQQNTNLASLNQRLVQQLKEEREAHAAAEAKLTMAETARTEAAQHLTQDESELVDLKRSVATYENMLKPKLAHELLECVNVDITPTATNVGYLVNFAKMSKTTALPASLTAQIKAVSGDNALTMAQAAGSANSATVTFNPTQSLQLKGTLGALPAGTTRLFDLKVYQGSDLVASCWKVF